MVIYCDYNNSKYYHGESFYTCQIYDQQTPENKAIELSGKHLNRKSAKNVTEISFNNCKISKIPQGITQLFTNLKVINISKSKLKAINRSDLAEYANLEIIQISENELEYLPGDLFVGFKKLNFIWFTSNKLSFIEPNILDGLQNLKVVNFMNNPKYSKCYSMYPVHKPNATLADVKNELFDQFNKRFNISKDADKIKDNLVAENQQLKDFRAILDQQVQTINSQLKLDQTMCQQLRENEGKLNKRIQQLVNTERNLKNKVQELEETLEEFKEENKELERDYESSSYLKDKCYDDINELKIEVQKYKNLSEFQADLIADFKKYIDDDTTKDYKIIIGNEEHPVHKILVAARSPTFAELIKTNPDNLKLSDIPELSNISGNIFKKVLKFIYTDELPRDGETNVLHLYAAAEKLKIEKLKEFALNEGLRKIDSENALEAFKLGHKYENLGIKNAAMNHMKRMYPEVAGETFSDASKVLKIIKMSEEKDAMLKKIKDDFKSSLTLELESDEDL